MPRRFATAVWVSPAAMRQCRTFFANCDTPLLLLVLEVWRGFSAISHSAYPIMDCRDDDRRFICKQQFSEHRHVLAQQAPGGPIVGLAPDGRKQPFVGDRSTQVVEETGQQC